MHIPVSVNQYLEYEAIASIAQTAAVAAEANAYVCICMYMYVYVCICMYMYAFHKSTPLEEDAIPG